MELISVIIPVYNTERYLKKCIDSFINQTYKNLEIILVDDGSTDSSPLICDKYKQKDNRIVVIHKKNGGLSDARNVGIEKSTGDFITFFDSDDYVDDDYIEYLIGLIKKYNVEMSVCGYSTVNETGKKISIVSGFQESAISKEIFFTRMLNETGITVSACFKLYKKRLFDSIRFPLGKLCEDNGTTYKVVDQVVGDIAYGNIPKGYYVVRQGSIMRSKFNIRKMDMIELNDEMCDYLSERYQNLQNLILRRRIYARFNVLRQIDYNDESTKEIMCNLVNYIKKYRHFIMMNNDVPKRDKMACLLLCIDIRLFYLSWNLYSRLRFAI